MLVVNEICVITIEALTDNISQITYSKEIRAIIKTNTIFGTYALLAFYFIENIP